MVPKIETKTMYRNLGASSLLGGGGGGGVEFDLEEEGGCCCCCGEDDEGGSALTIDELEKYRADWNELRVEIDGIRLENLLVIKDLADIVGFI